MINICFFSLKKNSARRDKTTIKVVYRLTDEVPYLFVFRALFCTSVNQ